MTESQLNKLKSAGFRRDEISHYKAGRFNKIAKKKIKEMNRIIKPKVRREIKPLVITEHGTSTNSVTVSLKKSRNIIILK